MDRKAITRLGFVAMGVAMLALGAGFAFNLPWAANFWPWPDGRLSFLFVGSVLAGLGSGALYIAVTQEWRAAIGGGLTFLAGATAIALSLFVFARDRAVAPGFIVGFLALAALALPLLYFARRERALDARPLPPLVRYSCWLFAAALAAAAVALILRAPYVFPWPLKPETALLYGWMFAGLALNYTYVAARGTWADGKVSLIAFLVYDLVLIGPFLRHFAVVRPEHLPSLTVYTAVLVYSTALAVAFLFVDRRTRLRPST
jgi:hypothetical protein